MKAIEKILLLALTALTFLSSCGREHIDHIVICQTSDIHGAYFDSLYTNNEINRTSLANVSTYLNSIRHDGYNPVLIDCGDNVQGDLAAYYYNYKNTRSRHLFLKIANYLKYDAIVIGNHDIEAGHDVYDRFKKQRRVPFLAANAVVDNSLNENDNGTPYFDEYTIVKRHGYRIAVIGMTNANIKNWLPVSQWSGIDFKNISDVAQTIVNKIKEQENPDITILAIHSGVGGESDDIENCGYYLASTLKDVDIIFAGHDHSPFAEMVSNPNGDIALVNPSSKCEYVGRCDVFFDSHSGIIVDKTISQQLIPMGRYSADERFLKRFNKEYEEIKLFATGEVGELTEGIDFSDALVGPSSYLSLIHTVQLKKSMADISIAAPLSVNGGVKAGTVTYQDLATIYKYENQLNVVQLTGKQIKDYLEYSYDLWLGGTGPSYNYDSADGIIYNVYRNNPYGSRIEIVSMSNGNYFGEDLIYKVAMTSYRASGGGGLLEKGACVNPEDLRIIESFADIRTLLYEYFAEVGKVTPAVGENWKFIDNLKSNNTVMYSSNSESVLNNSLQ